MSAFVERPRREAPQGAKPKLEHACSKKESESKEVSKLVEEKGFDAKMKSVSLGKKAQRRKQRCAALTKQLLLLMACPYVRRILKGRIACAACNDPIMPPPPLGPGGGPNTDFRDNTIIVDQEITLQNQFGQFLTCAANNTLIVDQGRVPGQPGYASDRQIWTFRQGAGGQCILFCRGVNGLFVQNIAFRDLADLSYELSLGLPPAIQQWKVEGGAASYYYADDQTTYYIVENGRAEREEAGSRRTLWHCELASSFVPPAQLQKSSSRAASRDVSRSSKAVWAPESSRKEVERDEPKPKSKSVESKQIKAGGEKESPVSVCAKVSRPRCVDAERLLYAELRYLRRLFEGRIFCKCCGRRVVPPPFPEVACDPLTARKRGDSSRKLHPSAAGAPSRDKASSSR